MGHIDCRSGGSAPASTHFEFSTNSELSSLRFVQASMHCQTTSSAASKADVICFRVGTMTNSQHYLQTPLPQTTELHVEPVDK